MNEDQFQPDIENAVCELPDEFFKEIDIQFLIHELKDPIAVIETGVRALLEKQAKFGALSPKQARTLKRTLRNCVKARGMLHGLLEVGRSESNQVAAGRFIPADVLQDVLVESLETLSGKIADALSDLDSDLAAMAYLAARGYDLVSTDRAHGQQAYQDELKFRQITGNLIKNAIHHCKDRVTVTVDVDNDWLCVEVADNGPGIDPEHHALVFQRYTQAGACEKVNRSGHGLGLAGAYVLSRNLGGDIKIKSETGKGATFCLYLPMNLPCTRGS